MEGSTIQFQRTFDWAGVLYPLFLINGFAVLLLAFDKNPIKFPIFWALTSLIVLGQSAYYLVLLTSPDRLILDEDTLVVHWPNQPRELSISRLELKVRKSNLFTGSYRISSRHESFYIFPGPGQGLILVEELLDTSVARIRPAEPGSSGEAAGRSFVEGESCQKPLEAPDPPERVLSITASVDVTYTPGAGDYVIVAIAAFFLLVFMPLITIVDLSHEVTASKILTAGFVLAMCLAMAVFALINRCSTFIVNKAGFKQVSPIGLGSWQLAPHDVVSADVERSRSGWVLILRSVAGRTRRIPLWGVLLEEIGCHFQRILEHYA